MLDTAPRESEARSWFWVAVGIGVIFATIPVARALREAVDRELGREVFLYACLLAVGIGGWLAWRSLQRRRLPRAAFAWLAAVLAIFAATIYYLRGIPEEALHVVEYAALSLLIYRALLHRVRDSSIYVLSAMLTGMVGISDEYIQWVVPSRHYDVDDIEVNFVSGVLAQIGLAAGLRPRLIRGWPGAAGLSRLGYVAAAGLLLLSIAFVNTPQRVAWYAERIPALDFLFDGSAMMAQYGYRLRAPAGGEFRSRFDAAELIALDRNRGREVAAALDRYIGGEGYREFLARYSIIRDPYVHEAGVHLFRREYHLDRAREPERDAGLHYTIAFHENDILRAFFPTALASSNHRWPAEVEAEVRSGTRLDEPYLSRVSGALITRIGQTQLLLLLVLGFAGALFAGIYFGRRRASGREG